MPVPDHIEKVKLDKILIKDRRHCPFDVELLNMIILIALVLVTVLRGSKSFESAIGIVRCSAVDWVILGVFGIVCLIVMVLAIRIVAR